MQVYHHSLHPSESDVRLGIAFISLAGMKVSDSKDWNPVLGGVGPHEAGVVKVKIEMHRVAKQKALAMEVRAFKLQDFTAWPASGGFVSLATSMVRDAKWTAILRQLQPQLHAAVMARQDSPHRVMLLLQGSPVLYAFGMVSSGGTMVTVRRAHDAEDALADGAHITPRTAFIEVHVDPEHMDRVDLARVLSGQRAKTLFQAAFQRPLVIDTETAELVRKHGAQPMDWWLQNFANAINIALTSSQYDSLHAHKQREAKRLMAIAAEQAKLAKEAAEAATGPGITGTLAAATLAKDIAADLAGDILGSVGLGRAGDLLGAGAMALGSMGPSAMAQMARGGLSTMGRSMGSMRFEDDSDADGPTSPEKKGLFGRGRRSSKDGVGLARSDSLLSEPAGTGGDITSRSTSLALTKGASLPAGAKGSFKRSFTKKASGFFGSKKKGDLEMSAAGGDGDGDDDDDELGRRPSFGEMNSTTDTRRRDFQQQLRRLSTERDADVRAGKEENTWSQLRRTPFPVGLLKKLQQSADKTAQELVGSLLTKSAFATLSELTRNSIATEQLERRDFALSADAEARERHRKLMKERALKQMKAIALKNMKGVGESAEEAEASAAAASGSVLGAGWLDICIDSYSGQPAEDTQAKRNELGQFLRTMGVLKVGPKPKPKPNPNPKPNLNPNPNPNPNPNKVGVQAVACMEEVSLTVDDDDIAAFRFFSSLEDFEEACKSKDLHPGLHRDRMALINMKELIETTEVDKSAAVRGAKAKNSIKVDGAALVAASEGHKGMLASLADKSDKKKGRRGSVASGEAERAARNSGAGGGRGLQRGKRLAISVFETKYSIVPEKVEHLRILAEGAHIKLGLYVADFPPNEEHVRLAELLVEKGFHTGKAFVFGPALMPLGSTTRLPRTPNAPPDTETTGRALPMLLGQLNPLKKGALGRAQRVNENLTIDTVRRGIHDKEHMRAEIEVCLVWMHRLLGGNPCSPTDQKWAMRLLSSRYATRGSNQGLADPRLADPRLADPRLADPTPADRTQTTRPHTDWQTLHTD
eukprot:scaffold5523_cov58-Phaeocystis_antarctica.AAC.5